MTKQIHFFTTSLTSGDNLIINFKETQDAIMNGKANIQTTQICFLSSELFKNGYVVFIHDDNNKFGRKIELDKNEFHTKEELMFGVDLFKLWLDNQI